MFDWLNSKIIWLAVLLWLATLFGGGCISSQGRTHGIAFIEHGTQVGVHVAGMAEEGFQGIVADVTYLAAGKVLIP